jgi:hypothetical protein
MKIYNELGIETDWAWVQSVFGGLKIEPRPHPGEPGWVVTELREDTTVNSISVVAMPDTLVARWWPDDSLPGLPDVFQHIDKGVYGMTSPAGFISFAMGQGDAYDPSHQHGASSVWCEGNSELVSGLGWIAGTHYRHLDVVFEWAEGEQPDTRLADLAFQLRSAVAHLNRAVGIVEEL